MINWAILGNATIARVCVAPAIAKSGNGRLHRVGSRTLARATQLTTQYGGTPVAGYEAVLADTAVDAVYIPLPNHLHHQWAIRALRAGKHVLCEKPLAMNAAEAKEMVKVAQQEKRHLLEAFMWRFHPRSQQIKSWVDDGKLGKIGSIRTAFTFPVQRDGSNERLFLPEMGGGALMDVGCYGVSVARWLMGQEPTAVTATATWGPTGVDLNFVGTLQFATGALAVIEAGFLSALQQTYSIQGDKGAIALPHNAFVPWQETALYTHRAHDDETGQTIAVPGTDEYQQMVEYFADLILGHTQPYFAQDESIQQMRVLDALKESAQTKRTIQLIPEP